MELANSPHALGHASVAEPCSRSTHVAWAKRELTKRRELLSRRRRAMYAPRWHTRRELYFGIGRVADTHQRMLAVLHVSAEERDRVCVDDSPDALVGRRRMRRRQPPRRARSVAEMFSTRAVDLHDMALRQRRLMTCSPVSQYVARVLRWAKVRGGIAR